MKNSIIMLVSVIAFVVLLVFSLFYLGVMWKSPNYYKVEKSIELKEPIMDMMTYGEIVSTHRRPYCYLLNSSSGGKVYILGIEHSRDKHHPQLDTIKHFWKEAKPTVALIEGRLGFLFTWFQDPVERYGEGGLVSQLSKQNGVDLFTWEPTKEDEIKLMLKDYTAEQLAVFYSFRPYFSNMRHGKPDNPEEKLQNYLDSRTDNDHLRGTFTSWEELDSLWENQFPAIEWRDYSDAFGWPEGYLSEIANASNLARDFHMVQSILDLVEKGETVFVTMGSSHAPRIEKVLKAHIK